MESDNNSYETPEGTPTPPEDLVNTEIESVIREREDLRAAAQRVQADFENFRKRAQRQMGEEAERKTAAVVSSLLPALDALDLAVRHAEERDELSTDGEALIQVRTLLLDELGKRGLEVLGQGGEPFDPERHDAVMHTPAEEDGEPSVAEVLREGYLWCGKVLRPAMVKVRG